MVFIAFEAHRIKKMGLAHRPINKVENIYECFIRVFFQLYKNFLLCFQLFFFLFDFFFFDKNIYFLKQQKKINQNLVLKSSKTAVKLKNDFENSDSDDSDDNNNNNNHQINLGENDKNEIANIKPMLKRSLTARAHLRPSFKNVGFKILLEKRTLRRFNDASTMVLLQLEKKLMSEYFEIDDKIYNSSFMRLFSKYVNFLIFYNKY